MAFHNLVSFTVKDTWLVGGKEETCAAVALTQKTPLNSQSSKSRVHQQCGPYKLPGFSQSHSWKACC